MACKEKKLQFSLLTLLRISVFTYFVLRYAQPELLSQPAPSCITSEATTATPQLNHSGQHHALLCLNIPLRSQHLPTVTLQTYAQMFPIFRIGNNSGFSGTTVWSWLGNDLTVPIITEKAKKPLKVVEEVLSQLEDSWLSWTKGHFMGIRFMMSTDNARNSSTRASQQRSALRIGGKANLDIHSLETPQPHRAPSSRAHRKQPRRCPVTGALPRLGNTQSSTQTWEKKNQTKMH